MNELDEIKRRIDIISFLSEYIQLKKMGRNFKALCPFHSEKTPSFVVSPERQIWHCFGGCQEGGDIFSFLMKIEGIDFPQALEILSQKAGVKIERKFHLDDKQKLREDILKANQLASNYYNFILTSHKVGIKAREYLKKRKINEKIINSFKLGYAPDNWDSLSKFLLKKGISEYIILKANLGIKSRLGNLIDRFHGRLIFTLKDHRGNIVGFSGRLIPGLTSTHEEAKYINTSETPVYIKGNLLFGLDITKEAIKQKNEVIIVEGEFDLLSSYKEGISNIVAIKGTALTVNQVSLIKRYTDIVVVSLDNDPAGLIAAKRSIEIAESAGMNIKVVQTPLGKDPDECVNLNPSAWKKAVDTAVPFYDFILNSALKKYNRSDAYEKKKIADEVLPFYSRISNTIVQSHYISLLSKQINVTEEKITILADKLNKVKSIGEKIQQKEKDKKIKISVEEYLLSLILQMPSLVELLDIINLQDLKKTISAFTDSAVKKIAVYLLDFIGKQSNSVFSAVDFIKTLPVELMTAADKAYLFELNDIMIEKGAFKKELLKTKDKLLYKYYKNLLVNISSGLENVDEVRLSEINKEFTEIQNNLKKVDR